MKYTKFGNTGMKVSVFGLGTMGCWTPEDMDTQVAIVKKAYELGINFFDSAEGYAQGLGDRMLGRAIKEIGCPRSDLVISTKIFWAKMFCETTPNEIGLSRKHIIEGMNASLARLEMDYVDVVFCHRFDRETTLEEVCCTMSWLVDQGKAFYWGTSEWPSCLISAAIEFCRGKGLHPPVVEQSEYNVLARERMEKECVPLFERYTLGTTVWSPLAFGFLAGRYNDGKAPEGSRMFGDGKEQFWTRYAKANDDKFFKKLRQFGDLAKENGMTQAQLALLWAISNYDISTCILGASKIEQLEDNLKVLEFVDKWDKELEDKVEAIFQNAPEPDTDFRTWQKVIPRRDYHLARIKMDN